MAVMGRRRHRKVVGSDRGGGALKKRKDSAAHLINQLKWSAPLVLDFWSAETDDEFESIFTCCLEKAVSHLEKNKRYFAKLDEEGLSGVFAGCLEMPGLTVLQETNSNGHVDLTIQVDLCKRARIKLAEAKIFSGPSYHIKGVGQLLGRYMTGRETPGLLLNYVRVADIKTITERIMCEMDKELPESQIGHCDTHAMKWSFRTKHRHSSGEEVSLSHIGVNLYF